MNVANIFINILIFIIECCANVLGINTQENPNHRNFVRKLNINEKFDNFPIFYQMWIISHEFGFR